jgi:hypothetical protein
MDQGTTGIGAGKPTTHQADLAKLPRALKPLLGLPQWGRVPLGIETGRRLAEAAIPLVQSASQPEHERPRYMELIR